MLPVLSFVSNRAKNSLAISNTTDQKAGCTARKAISGLGDILKKYRIGSQ